MNRINGKIKTVWGISEVGFSIMATMETTFLVFFLTDVAQLPLSITAIITGFSALADAISAVLAGIVIDKVNFKAGKFRPWLLYLPIFVVAFFIFEFTKVGGNTTAGLIIGFGYIVSHFLWNIAWTANRNLIPKLSDDPAEKSFLSARIAMGSSLGKLICSWFVPFMSSVLLGIFSGVTAYTGIAGVSGFLFLICYFIHYGITAGYDTESGAGKKAVTFGDMAKGIATNPHLILFLLHDAIRLMAYYGTAATAAYFCKVVLGNPGKVSTLMILFYAGTLIGSAFSAKIAAKIGSKMTNIVFTGLSGIIFVVCFISPASLYVTGAFLFLAELSFGVAYGLTSNMYAMCGTYSVWKTGEDTRGVIMAFCSLAIKIAIALRGILISAILAAIAYDPNATTVTAEAINGIKILFILVPAGLSLVSILPMFLFKLSDEKVVEMEKEIAQKA